MKKEEIKEPPLAVRLLNPDFKYVPEIGRAHV